MKIKKAEYLKNYEVKLLFSNGITKIVNFKPVLSGKRKLFEPLHDLEYFKSFFIDDITICWPNELDFDPDFLYEMGKELKKEAKKNPQKRRAKPSTASTHSRRGIVKSSSN